MKRESRAYIEGAIRNRAFSLVYQPIVHLDSGTLSGVEALCRFYDTRSPEVWFARCRELGLATAMDLAIIEQALQDIDALPAGYLALNLSLETLTRADDLLSLLRPALPRRQIVIELTEHVVVSDYDFVKRQLTPLRDAGVLLAVDDAGAGYSTFQHILRLRPEVIKLDRSITESIDKDRARRALATALVIFAGEVGASVVAEGIETEAELLAVRATGIGRGQGYGLGRPQQLPLADLDYKPVPFIDLVHEAAAASAHVPGLHPAATSDATMAVLAHGLLSGMASITSAITMLSQTDGKLEPDRHRALCAAMHRQAAHISGVLEDLVRGLPPETVQALDRLAVKPQPT